MKGNVILKTGLMLISFAITRKNYLLKLKILFYILTLFNNIIKINVNNFFKKKKKQVVQAHTYF